MTPISSIANDELIPTCANEADGYAAFPLTPAQIAMLPDDLAALSDPRWNGAFRMRIEGPVDTSFLATVFQELVRRHESLRTVFLTMDGNVRQVVLHDSTFTLGYDDLRSLDAAERDVTLDRICAEEAKTGFPLATTPPLRVRLLQLEDSSFVLTLTVHQIICDGWSIGIILDEVTALYRAVSRSGPIPAQRTELQFGDYAVWQESESSSSEIDTDLRYWKTQLDQYTPLRIAPDFADATTTADSDIVSTLLPRSLSDAIHQLARTQSTTFFVVTLSTCLALLNRYSGRSDVAVCTPLAGRNRVEFEEIIGQFVNPVVIRSAIPSDDSFLTLLHRVRETFLEALAHQNAPYSHIVDSMAAAHGVDPDRVFGINFICQCEYGRNGCSTYHLDKAQLSTMPSKSQGALYDLNFFLVERAAGWRLSIEYRSRLYTQDTAKSLLAHFEQLLAAFVADPRQQLHSVPLSHPSPPCDNPPLRILCPKHPQIPLLKMSPFFPQASRRRGSGRSLRSIHPAPPTTSASPFASKARSPLIGFEPASAC